MGKLCKHILHKNNSKRNVIKENDHSNRFLNYLLVGLLDEKTSTFKSVV